MNFFKANKTTILAAIIIVALVYVYFTYFRSSDTQLLTATNAPTEQSAGLLLTLANLHTLQLDNSIFSDPVFLSLTDFGVQIDPQNVGRRNPFAPIGTR